MSFNPLFIGAGFLTRDQGQIDQGGKKFQSPIHRGWVFNQKEPDTHPRGPHAFQSPIHRGWVFNAGIAGTTVEHCTSFNPLFIGAGFLTHFQARHGDLPILWVSIPYSSGLGF